MTSKHSRGTAATAASAGSSSSGSKATANDRLAAYRLQTTGVSDKDRDETIPSLAVRSYHLPGNSWCDDWFQYFANNHPIFGICCHHRLHPVTSGWRIVNLFGSFCFGLAITNLIWLWYVSSDDRDADNTVITISIGNPENETDSVFNGNSTWDDADNATLTRKFLPDGEIQVTEGMLLLWTVGGGLHALFDNTVWYITACVCCLPGQRLECLYKYKWCGTYLVILAVVLTTAIASFVVVFRASLEEDDEDLRISDLESAGIFDDTIELGRNIGEAEKWEFLISYSVELGLALLVHYFIVGTILFSGILGCGRVPILGGRPFEVASERRRLEREHRRRRTAAQQRKLQRHPQYQSAYRDDDSGTGFS